MNAVRWNFKYATLALAVAATLTACGGDSSNAPDTSGIASLPADLLLRPAAGNCTALRNCVYRTVRPKPNSELAAQYSKFTITNVGILSVTPLNGNPGNWTASDPCRYTDDNGNTNIVVSPAGVIVKSSQSGDDVTHHLEIAIPDQAHTQAEISGNWSALRMHGNNGTFSGAAINFSVDAAGAVTSRFCNNPQTWDVIVCDPEETGVVSLKANSDGGFDNVRNGTLIGRTFAYRAGGGELMLVSVDSDGTFTLSTRQRHTDALPAVGTVNTGWTVSLNDQLTSVGGLSEFSNTVVSVDTAAGSFVRKTNNPGATNHHLETLLTNRPRDGYIYRVPDTAAADDGTTVNVRAFIALNLRGMGMAPLLVPSLKTFLLAVNKP